MRKHCKINHRGAVNCPFCYLDTIDNLRFRILELRKLNASLERALKAFLVARGTNPDAYSSTAFKDESGYATVECNRGKIEVVALDGAGGV